MAHLHRALALAWLIGGCSTLVADPGASGGADAGSAATGTSAGGSGDATSGGGAAGHGGAGGGALVGAGGAPSTSSGFDAGVPLVDAGIEPASSAEACLARVERCTLGEDLPPDRAAMHLQEVLTTCGSMNGCPNGCFCGELTVSFDAQGCALAIGYDSGLLGEVEACLVQHLNDERWTCGAGTVAHVLVPCTTRK